MKEPNPENKNLIEKYMTEKTPEEWRKIFLEDLRGYYDDYSDEIPEKIVNGQDEGVHKYKVRGNWFFAVRETLKSCELIKLFPEDFNTECHEFFKKYTERRIKEKGEHRTTKEELERANEILLKAQEILSNSK